MRGTGRVIALISGLVMLLSACTLLPSPAPTPAPAPTTERRAGGAELAPGDILTITLSRAGLDGDFGTRSIKITEDAVASRYNLPNDAEIYDLTEELAAPDRKSIEQAAGDYLEWHRTLPKGWPSCEDVSPDRVEISGSVTLVSTVQDCAEDTPLRALKQRVHDVQGEFPRKLAHPTDDWTIEIRPWAGGGPDESADVEQYALTRARHGDGMGITAQNAPSGWGVQLVSEDDGPAPLGWDATGTVLTEINVFLLGRDQLGCDDQIGEIRLVKQGELSLSRSNQLCPGQQSEALAQTLRDL